MTHTLWIATLIAFGASMLWLAHIYKLDVHRKEDKRLLMKVFFFGCLSAVLAMAINTFIGAIGGMAVVFIFVGFVEEGVKYGAVKLSACRHRDFDEPMDGILFGGTAALGFAFVENIQYNLMGFMDTEMTASMLLVRSVTPFLHLLLSGLWGASLGLYKLGHLPRSSVYKMLLMMALAHSAYDLGSLLLPPELTILWMIGTLVGLAALLYRKIDALNALSPYKQPYTPDTPTTQTRDHGILYCAQCGSRVGANARFCAGCGSKII